ncbi:hypothetical protein [Phenylobacterium sp.]|uniref:hypothetical protein n=1 Tax=Phenylobacterium sp. TaxID=1871053 RepID=UPI002734D985|nr:hypothetical protein [Phenylobacterium sp.]MDP3659223.1 hypothetical protein [Phenylobacterium sp.]
MVQLFKGRFGRRLEALMVRATVEGQQSAASVSLIEGRPVYTAAPIPKGAPPNMALLAELLRGRHPISADMRHWLAALCDPDGNSEMKLGMTKRRNGRPRESAMEHFEAVRQFMENQSAHGFEYAVARGKSDHGLSRTTLLKAVRILRPAIEEDERLMREHSLGSR